MKAARSCRRAATRAPRSRSWRRSSAGSSRVQDAPRSETSRGTGSRCWRSIRLRPVWTRWFEAVRATPPASGFERVQAPGDPETETEAARRRDGIPVPEATWQSFVELGGRYGVAVT